MRGTQIIYRWEAISDLQNKISAAEGPLLGSGALTWFSCMIA